VEFRSEQLAARNARTRRSAPYSTSPVHIPWHIPLKEEERDHASDNSGDHHHFRHRTGARVQEPDALRCHPYPYRLCCDKTPLFKGGEASLDRVLERQENAYWKIEVCDFKTWSMGFVKFQGEWSTKALAAGGVRVTYRYTLFSTSHVLYPLHWLFTKLVWRTYMKQALENVRELTLEKAPYLYP
jgi:hypothetical protein